MAPSGPPKYIPHVIDSEPKLAGYLPVLRSANWVAVDTEADSLHAYPEKVCLIQISTLSGDRLVDPLARLDLNPLLDALTGHELIMHGADYDLRLLRKHHEFVPSAIFDTMLAARLLGLRQFGLSHLVEKFLGVKLEKGPQKADWAVRPLTERMERYARNGSSTTRRCTVRPIWTRCGASEAAICWNGRRSPSCASSGCGVKRRRSVPTGRPSLS
jgi:ribonuclease D